MNTNEQKIDKGLQENEKIEEAIKALQQEPTQEILAHALTVIRRRMKEGGQFIVAVEPQSKSNGLNIQAVQTEDGAQWWIVFTSFEEEIRGAGSVMSTFLTDMQQVFESALGVEEIKGVIVNPWNRTLMLDKSLLRIILGK